MAEPANFADATVMAIIISNLHSQNVYLLVCMHWMYSVHTTYKYICIVFFWQPLLIENMFEN